MVSSLRLLYAQEKCLTYAMVVRVAIEPLSRGTVFRIYSACTCIIERHKCNGINSLNVSGIIKVQTALDPSAQVSWDYGESFFRNLSSDVSLCLSLENCCIA